jgi:opacity protein-like surface antigen
LLKRLPNDYRWEAVFFAAGPDGISWAAGIWRFGKCWLTWNDGSATYAAGVSYTVNGNVTLTARWAFLSVGTVTDYLDDTSGGAAEDLSACASDTTFDHGTANTGES